MQTQYINVNRSFTLNTNHTNYKGNKNEFWIKSIPELNEKGTLVKGGFLPSQLKAWNLKSYIKGFIGGYGSGKTELIAKRAISKALQHAPMPHLTISPTHKMATRTTKPALRNYLAGKGRILDDFKWKENKNENSFTIWFEGKIATIWTASGDDPQMLKGPNVASVSIDEPFIQSEDVFTQSIARVRGASTSQEEVFIAGTPEGVLKRLNWGYRLFFTDDYDYSYLTKSHVQVSTKENFILGERYEKRLMGALTKKAQMAYLHGQFVDMVEGRIYYGFNENVNEIHKPYDHLEKKLGLDFNVNPMTAIVFVNDENSLHVIETIELFDSHTGKLCEHVKRHYPEIKKVYPDASGVRRQSSAGTNTDFTILDNYGFEIDAPTKNGPVSERELIVNGLLENKRLTVEPNGKNDTLVNSFAGLTEDNRDKKEGKDMSHSVDACGYPCVRLFPVPREHYRPMVEVIS